MTSFQGPKQIQRIQPSSSSTSMMSSPMLQQTFFKKPGPSSSSSSLSFLNLIPSSSSSSNTLNFSFQKFKEEEINRYFFEFGQFLCRKIAFTTNLNLGPLYPGERARICIADSSVSVVFQGNIIKTLIFENTNSWHSLFLHSEDIIRLPYPYSHTNLRNLILAIADYVTLYDLPIHTPFPLWLISIYDNYIKIFFDFNPPSSSSSSSSSYTFRDLVVYLTRFTDFDYVSNSEYRYKSSLPLPFPPGFDSDDNDKLYWIYLMTMGALFHEIRPTPSDFAEQVSRGLVASKQKAAVVGALSFHKSLKLSANVGPNMLSRFPWISCFDPVVLEDREISHLLFKEKEKVAGLIHLHICFILSPGASPDLHVIFSRKTPQAPLLYFAELEKPRYMPVCEPDEFRGRYTLSYRKHTKVRYPITFQVNGKQFMIDSNTLISQRQFFDKTSSYLDALCPLEGDLFWKPLGKCAVYNNLEDMQQMPMWYAFF